MRKYLRRNCSCRVQTVKKGFTIIEVLCSITIFSLLFTAILTIQLTAFKLKTYSEKLNNYSAFMEVIKNNFMCNYSGIYITGLKHSGRCYIKVDNIKINALKELSIDEMLVKNQPKEPYLHMDINEEKIDIDEGTGENTKGNIGEEEININKHMQDNVEEGNKILNIKLKLYTGLKGKNEIMECEFYKGMYKK